MKAYLEIEIKRINDIRVTKQLIADVPKLVKSTEKTLKQLSSKIEEYFKDYKIEVKVKQKLMMVGDK